MRRFDFPEVYEKEILRDLNCSVEELRLFVENNNVLLTSTKCTVPATDRYVHLHGRHDYII
jgi:hypothetical protein